MLAMGWVKEVEIHKRVQGSLGDDGTVLYPNCGNSMTICLSLLTELYTKRDEFYYIYNETI